MHQKTPNLQCCHKVKTSNTCHQQACENNCYKNKTMLLNSTCSPLLAEVPGTHPATCPAGIKDKLAQRLFLDLVRGLKTGISFSLWNFS